MELIRPRRKAEKPSWDYKITASYYMEMMSRMCACMMKESGVSGQKRIDQREKLDELYKDMHKGIIGTIVLAREDRLFRNKHMDQVGRFTELAEKMRIKVIVPPISSVARYDETRVYDFTDYQDLRAFQDKMREAYAYIEGPIKHANQCKQNKADKGGYDGRGLPPGLVVKGKKQNQFNRYL